MGNNSGKKLCEDPRVAKLDQLFNKISNQKNYILRSDLKVFWSSQIDDALYAKIESYLFSPNKKELTCENFKEFFLDICKGDLSQKIDVLFKLLDFKDEIPGPELLQFIVSVLNSILLIQESKSSKKLSLWKNKGADLKMSKESLQCYAAYFLNQTQKNEKDNFTREDLHSVVTRIDIFLHMVLSRLYDTEEKHYFTSLLPKWRYGALDSGKNLGDISVFDLCKIIFLNMELPVDFQHEWRLLFSTQLQGESFSKLSGAIINKGPTIIVVQDKGNHIFGGFAPCSWSLGPNFFGDSRSFLFTLHPQMNLFVATNFNENYQYINVGQQTMPNGLGMGGRLEYFGMWLSAEFGTGYCSESCTTYRNYKMMSSSKDFEIAHLEVWGVGPPPEEVEDLEGKSILKGNAEAKAMLEMAGKTVFSDDFE